MIEPTVSASIITKIGVPNEVLPPLEKLYNSPFNKLFRQLKEKVPLSFSTFKRFHPL